MRLVYIHVRISVWSAEVIKLWKLEMAVKAVKFIDLKLSTSAAIFRWVRRNSLRFNTLKGRCVLVSVSIYLDGHACDPDAAEANYLVLLAGKDG